MNISIGKSKSNTNRRIGYICADMGKQHKYILFKTSAYIGFAIVVDYLCFFSSWAGDPTHGVQQEAQALRQKERETEGLNKG